MMESWVRTALLEFGLDEDVYTPYVMGILADDSIQADDKHAAVLELLASASDKDLSLFGVELSQKLREVRPSRNEAQTALNGKPTTVIAQPKEQRIEQKKAKQQLSKHDEQRREALLAQYGYQIEMTDENGDIVLSVHDKEEPSLVEEHRANNNSRRIAQEEQNKRVKAKEQHAQKVLRDKEALKKDQEKKEKRKRATQKREKRRGFG